MSVKIIKSKGILGHPALLTLIAQKWHKPTRWLQGYLKGVINAERNLKADKGVINDLEFLLGVIEKRESC